MDARGMKPEVLAEGAHRSSMDELTACVPNPAMSEK